MIVGIFNEISHNNYISLVKNAYHFEQWVLQVHLGSQTAIFKEKEK